MTTTETDELIIEEVFKLQKIRNSAEDFDKGLDEAHSYAELFKGVGVSIARTNKWPGVFICIRDKSEVVTTFNDFDDSGKLLPLGFVSTDKRTVDFFLRFYEKAKRGCILEQTE